MSPVKVRQCPQADKTFFFFVLVPLWRELVAHRDSILDYLPFGATTLDWQPPDGSGTDGVLAVEPLEGRPADHGFGKVTQGGLLH